MRRSPAYALALGLACFLAPPLFAAPAGPGVKAPSQPTCFLNKKEAARHIQRMKAFNAKRVGTLAPPSNPAPHVLAIRVDFSDEPMATTLGTAQTFFSNLRSFYIENSFGVFVPTFTVTVCATNCGANQAYRLPSPLATYGADCGGDVACNNDNLLAAAVSRALNDMGSFAGFNQIMIYHAGNGQETSGSGNDIWSVFMPDSFTAGTVNFDGFTVVPETEDAGSGITSPLGVIAHEYGHQLGLPDLYDVSVSGGKSTVGAWDIMDYPYTGATAQDGSNPPHFGAWSKKFLGFATVTTLSQDGNLSLPPAETGQTGFVQIPIAGASVNEYFLVEYRKRDAGTWDRGLPMAGALAIWHIDDDIALDSSVLNMNTVNAPALSGRGHRGVDLVEKDGSEANPSVGDLGNSDGYIAGDIFASPKSDAFSGKASSVTITDISGIGTALTAFNVSLFDVAPTVSILKVVNYPNPGGSPAKYPVRTGAPAGTVTTLVLQLTRPSAADKLNLDIYTLAGERIRSVSGTDIALKVGGGEPTGDFKWVYEYDWNGKNDSGDEAASGVYTYRFTADGKIKTGKLMIVR